MNRSLFLIIIACISLKTFGAETTSTIDLQKAHQAVEYLKRNKDSPQLTGIITYVENVCSSKANIETINVQRSQFKKCADCHFALKLAGRYQEINSDSRLTAFQKIEAQLHLNLLLADFNIYQAETQLESINKRLDKYR